MGIYCFLHASLSMQAYNSFLCVHDFARKFTPCPDLWTIEDQNPGHDGQQRTNAAQQTARRTVAQFVIHLSGDKGKDATEHVSAKRLRRKRGTSIPVICIRQVVEYTKVDSEDADGCN